MSKVAEAATGVANDLFARDGRTTSSRVHRRAILSTACLVAMALVLSPLGTHVRAQSLEQQVSDANAVPELTPMQEIEVALVRLPLAAVLGTLLALRPRRRGQARPTVTVVQTQIMLAVVGAVIMIIVSGSLSRAFGIVGIIGLVRFRTDTDDPKEAVVMLTTLSAGLASGVGLYVLAPFATFFMGMVLWVVEYFEPHARKQFVLTISTKQAPEFRSKVESVMHGLQLQFELLGESDDEISYSVSAPLDVHTRDISDTFHLLTSNKVEVEWKEKRK